MSTRTSKYFFLNEPPPPQQATGDQQEETRTIINYHPRKKSTLAITTSLPLIVSLFDKIQYLNSTGAISTTTSIQF